MTKINTSRLISAPLGRVFSAIAEPENFADAVPHLVKIEFLSNQTTGVGTRFKETRLMKGREASTELEITEYEENSRVRMVSDAGGTIWDTVFTVAEEADYVRLDMEMEARPYKFMSRLMTPMIRGMVARAIEEDMDAVKAWCEQSP